MKRKNLTEMVEIDTPNILFIVGGAFIGLEKIVEDRLNKGGMGFGVDIKDAEKEQDPSEVLTQRT